MPDPGTAIAGGAAVIGAQSADKAAQAQADAIAASGDASAAALAMQTQLAREAQDISNLRYAQALDMASPYLMGGQSAYNQVLAQMGLPVTAGGVAGGSAVSIGQQSALGDEQISLRSEMDSLQGDIPSLEKARDKAYSTLKTLSGRSGPGIDDAKRDAKRAYNKAITQLEGTQSRLSEIGTRLTDIDSTLSASHDAVDGEVIPAETQQIEAMDLSQSPLYQSYLEDLRGKQQYAFDEGLEALQQNLATQGLLGSGTALEEITNLSSRAFQAPSATEVMMPYLMNLSGTGQSTAMGLGSLGQGQAAQSANIMGQQASQAGQYGSNMANLALMGGNVAAQQAMIPYQSLMGGMNMYSQLSGSGAFGGGSAMPPPSQPIGMLGSGQDFGGYV